MNNIGKYIYGVIPRPCSPWPDGLGTPSDVLSSVAGQVNSNTPFRLFIPKDFIEGGKNGTNGLYIVPYQDISAVVSDLEIVDYTHLRKDFLALQLVRHQKAIEKIMNLDYVVIPVRLGTFARDIDEVKYILTKGYSIIKDIFSKIFDKIEIDVVATWSDFNSVLKEIGEEKEIKEFKEKLLTNPKSITLDDQMKVGFMVKKALGEKSGECAQAIQNALKVLSQDFKIHELMDDKMIINTAFLINKHEQKDFDRKLEELNTEFAEKLNFRCVGPLPPYSFYTLEVKKMQFEEIDWARKKLGLSDIMSKDEVKKAYHKIALLIHPDKNPDLPDAEKEFNEANKAYNILVDYCLASEQAGQAENCLFKGKDFNEDAILVKVKE